MTLTVPCLFGLESLVADEMKRLQLQNVRAENGRVHCDGTLADIARLTDVFYLGGTKCGAMIGEAVVILNQQLQRDFRFYMKQRGAVLAKGWLMGLQFAVLLRGSAPGTEEEPLYFSETRRAAEYAMTLRDAFRAKDIPFFVESPTNQQFVILSDDQLQVLEDAGHLVEYMDRTDESHRCVRFCTSWSTRPEDLKKLLSDIDLL